ncbi:MAG: WYL domain-containing protein, partial [Clostridia bacterium]|nr:WYL domain-containing protein [Clostridia bacterium]
MIPNKKSSMLLVLKILEEYSDEEHYLTQSEIIDKIYRDYDIELERKSVSSSLSLLEELDYDIDRGPKGGFALLSRTFDETEAFYLIDAIFSSRSIEGKEAKRIADAVASCFSRYQRKDYSYIYKSSDINRTNNKQVLYNVSIIHEAMKQGKKIGFQYLSYDASGNQIVRRGGYQFIVSPYYLVNNFGRYYLLCNYKEKYGTIQTFRVDYMVNIEIKENYPLIRMNELENPPKNFSISKYLNDHIYLFGGETIEAELELDSKHSIIFVKDWFGESAKI